MQEPAQVCPGQVLPLCRFRPGLPRQSRHPPRLARLRPFALSATSRRLALGPLDRTGRVLPPYGRNTRGAHRPPPGRLVRGALLRRWEDLDRVGAGSGQGQGRGVDPGDEGGRGGRAGGCAPALGPGRLERGGADQGEPSFPGLQSDRDIASADFRSWPRLQLRKLDCVLLETITYRYPSPANPAYLVRAPPRVETLFSAQASVSLQGERDPGGFAVLDRREGELAFGLEGTVPADWRRMTVRTAKVRRTEIPRDFTVALYKMSRVHD